MSLWGPRHYDAEKACGQTIGLRSLVEQDDWRKSTICLFCAHYDGRSEPSEFVAWHDWDDTDEYEGYTLCGRHAMDVRNYLEQKHRE